MIHDAGTFQLSDGFMAYIRKKISRKLADENKTFTAEGCSFGITLHTFYMQDVKINFTVLLKKIPWHKHSSTCT